MSLTKQEIQEIKEEIARRQASKSGNSGEENLLQKVVRYGIKDPAIGLLNMGREFANLPNKISGGRIPELSPSDYNFGETLGVENPEPADKLIQFAGQYAPSFLLPEMQIGKAGQAISKIPKVGKYLKTAIGEAIPQALYAATQSHEPIKSAAETGGTQIPFSLLTQLMGSTNPKVKTMAKILGFGASGLLGREAAKGLGFGETGSDLAAIAAGALGGRGMNTRNDMMERLTEGVSGQIANPRLQAANRLGLDYLTPAEAGVSPWAAKRQGSLGKTEEGGRLLYEKGIKRRESEKNAIERTLDMIYHPETMEPLKKEAYGQIKSVNLPTEFPEQFRNNAVINQAEKIVKKTPAYQESLKHLLPENVKLKEGESEPLPTSLVYWDHVKRALDDMVENARDKGKNTEAGIISKIRNDMRDQMDQAYPEYAQARAYHERMKTREGLEKVFDQKEINGTNFYRALASDKKFNELMHHLRDVPEAAQNLKDMRLLFNDLMGPPTIKTAKGTEERGMNQARSSGAFLENLLEHLFTKGANDKAAIDFITSKDWAKQMQDIKKISDNHLRLVALSMALSKGVSQYAGQSD